MIERSITVRNGEISLAGTISTPDQAPPWPAVLLVHGSGPLDRNENMKGQRLDIFNTLANHLAANGVASMRYDKRGCGESTGNYLEADHTDLVEDAAAMSEYLLADQQLDPVYLLGHSEGSLIVPQVASRCPGIDGMILICPIGTPLEQVLIQQARQMAADTEVLTGPLGVLMRAYARVTGGPEQAQQALITALKASTKPVIRQGLRRVNAAWLRELLTLDVEAVYRAATCPALIIGGAKDIQCDPADVHRIADWIPAATDAVVMPDLSHVLRRESQAPSFFRYRQLLARPVDEEVLERVVGWLTARTEVRPGHP